MRVAWPGPLEFTGATPSCLGFLHGVATVGLTTTLDSQTARLYATPRANFFVIRRQKVDYR
jgi:hypothetical protein